MAISLNTIIQLLLKYWINASNQIIWALQGLPINHVPLDPDQGVSRNPAVTPPPGISLRYIEENNEQASTRPLP